ncbi:hypothetical protein BMETH_285_1 [methanotrophic bacterial endosymbiont of Bathymodiolus sp.]|nr:hypothetical protein BMETH_285_1 [methanotrophic bacterial endosymbiont of Bathymodiolus sp.]
MQCRLKPTPPILSFSILPILYLFISETKKAFTRCKSLSYRVLYFARTREVY